MTQRSYRGYMPGSTSHKKTVLALGLALILAAGGLATASNFAFKFVKNYSSVAPNINTLSLPYSQNQLTHANDLFNDIGATAARVCRLEPNFSPTCWLGNFAASPNFAIRNGDALLVAVTAPTTWVPDHY